VSDGDVGWDGEEREGREARGRIGQLVGGVGRENGGGRDGPAGEGFEILNHLQGLELLLLKFLRRRRPNSGPIW